MDETIKQLIGETREPLPPRPGRVERFDHVYTSNGVASLFAAFEPLRGWRRIAVTDQRRRLEWSQFVRAMVDGAYRRAEKVVLVMDQLNTHSAASLYEAFPPAEAKRIADRLEIHHTPKHGGWLNMAEIELSALSRQCLSRRIAKRETLATAIALDRRTQPTTTRASIGSSPPPTPASNSNDSIHRLTADRTLE